MIKKIVNTYRLPEEFRKISIGQTCVALCFDWGLIIASIAFSEHFKSLPVYLCSLLVIASRQHALFYLVHEAAHYHLCKSRKINNLISDLFCGWPIAISTERFRVHHWQHHKHTNTNLDPDWIRKVNNPHWQFPKGKKKFWSDFLGYFWGRGILEIYFALKIIGFSKREWFKASLYFAGMLSFFFFTKTFHYFLFYWVGAYFSFFPVLNKVRSIAEHLALPNTNTYNSSRNIYASPVEAFFFGPHGNSLHLVHHLYPNIPWHMVSSARECLVKNDQIYQSYAYENKGYFLGSENSVYVDLIGKTKIENKEIFHGKLAS